MQEPTSSEGQGTFAVVDRRMNVIVSLHDDEKKAQNAAWVNGERYMVVRQPYHVTIGQRPDRSVKLNIDPDRCWDDVTQTDRESGGAGEEEPVEEKRTPR